MKSPDMSPWEKTPEPEKVIEEKTGLSFIPDKPRRKILRVLRRSLRKPGYDMPQELRNQTINTIVGLTEARAIEDYGDLVDSRYLHKNYDMTGEFDEADRWAQTTNLKDSESFNNSNT